MTEASTLKPTPVRLPEALRIWLKHQAVDNRRSLTAEIVLRLEQSQQLQQQKDATHAK